MLDLLEMCIVKCKILVLTEVVTPTFMWSSWYKIDFDNKQDYLNFIDRLWGWIANINGLYSTYGGTNYLLCLDIVPAVIKLLAP